MDSLKKEQILGLRPALRGVKSQNVVKSVLTVEPMDHTPLVDVKAGMVIFHDENAVAPVAHMRKDFSRVALPKFTYKVSTDYDMRKLFKELVLEYPKFNPKQIKAMMAPKLADKLMAAVELYESFVDVLFFERLALALPNSHRVSAANAVTAYDAGLKAMEASGYRVFGLYSPKDLQIDRKPERIFSPPTWRMDPDTFYVTSTQDKAGTMKTSPLHIDMTFGKEDDDGEVPDMTLVLSKQLGFLVQPKAFAECKVKGGNE